ncbi:MAG: guanylate kinase [Thermodesulfobacteriota bacterium]|nr:guanylate kinase [Thermodesulfobacteriota bacterium]
MEKLPLDERGLFVVVSAPSGTGKTTICKEVLKIVPGLRFSISCTTREPRRGESDGRDYHFISKEEFEKRISGGDFVEWAENHGHLYGTLKKNVEGLVHEGYDVLFDVDPRGAKELKSQYNGAVFVFILPPSIDILKERLKRRGSEKNDMMNARFERAFKEIREVVWYDYAIFNDIIDESVDVLKSVYKAEKNRRERLNNRIKNIIG